MKGLIFFTTMFFCYIANAYNENVESHHVQEYFAKTGSSGYTASDEKEIQPRSPLEVYELSAYRHRRQEVTPQPQQQYIPPVYNYQQPPAMYNTQQQMQVMQPQRQNQIYEQQYTQRTQQGGMMPQLTKSSAASKVGKSNTVSLFNYNKYYAMNIAHPFKSSTTFTDTGSSSQTISNNGFVPLVNKNGSLGFYVGKRIQRLRALRYEYGVQWEVLSFEYTTSTRCI